MYLIINTAIIFNVSDHKYFNVQVVAEWPCRPNSFKQLTQIMSGTAW